MTYEDWEKGFNSSVRLLKGLYDRDFLIGFIIGGVIGFILTLTIISY